LGRRIDDAIEFFSQPVPLEKVHLSSYLTEEEFTLAWSISYLHRIFSKNEEPETSLGDELRYGMKLMFVEGWDFESFDFDDDDRLVLCSLDKIGPGPGIIVRIISSPQWPYAALTKTNEYLQKYEGKYAFKEEKEMLEEALSEMEQGVTPAQQLERSEAEWN
jgi:hypothetical protein